MAEPTEAVSNESGTLQSRCDLLRSLHVPSRPLLLPNAWDAATARAVVTAGLPVVATTSAGITAALGYQDHERAPREEMFLAAGRIVRSVDVPVTVDLEAGHGLEPAELLLSCCGSALRAATWKTPTTAAEVCATPISRPTGCAAYEKRRTTRTIGW
jgi:hypothetical protein